MRSDAEVSSAEVQKFLQLLAEAPQRIARATGNSRDLSTKDWSRSAVIKERTETVLSYTRYLTEHETAHCEQIEELLK